MKLYVNWKTAFKAIRKNGKRSVLTMIGIIIGIAAVITIMAIGRGFQRQTVESLTNSKDGQVTVNVDFTPKNENLSGNTAYFNQSDLKLLTTVDGVAKADFPKTEDTGEYLTLPVKNESQSLQLSFALADQPNLLAGRLLTKEDGTIGNKVVTIDEKLAQDLFGNKEKALQHGLTLNGQVFTIVGVYEASAQDSIFSMPSSNITAPQKVYRRYFPLVETAYGVELTLKDGVKPNEVTEAALDKLKENGSMKDQGEYSVFDLSILTDGIGKVLGGITAFISAVAGISLFIAGVGVMNMMYISVSERTKEIGIRRALGATQRAIMLQFLLEGISLTLLGGVIGYVLGMILAYGIGAILKVPIAIDLFTVSLAVGIATVIGLIFSVFPARQAAKKDLIDILR